MASINISDLNNAKLDVDHIAEVATSPSDTATDRFGHVKKTLAGAVGTIAAINNRGAWVTGTAYALKDLVSNSGTWYICVSAHTSGATFAGDASSSWRVYQGVIADDLANSSDPLKGVALVAGAGRIVSSISALRALPTTGSRNVIVTGYFASGDGGGGIYYYDSADTATADNGGTVIVASDGGRWKLSNIGFINLRQFGATTGNADQTTAIQNALNSGAMVIDGQGMTYRVDNTLNVPSGVTLQNASFNFANASANATLIQANGTLGSGASFTAATRGAASLTVSSAAGIAANSLLYIESGTIFGSGATKNGEFVRVLSVAGTILTPYRRLQDNYSASPTFYIPAMRSNITLRNLRMTGRGNGYSQKAMMFYLCQNVRVENVISEFFGERHLQFQRCINATASGCNFSHCDTSTGLAYGVVVANGTERATVTGCNFRDMRHGITVGAENGVDRYVALSGNTTTDCTDSGIDCHPQAQYVSITGNVCGQDSTNSGQDGISVQCANATITGNVVQGFSRIGILYQSLTTGGPSNDHPVISGNQVIQPVGSGPIYGIYVQNQRTPAGMRFSVTGNTVDVAQVTNSIGILIEGHSAGSDFAGGTISGNTVYSAQIGLKVLMAANKFLRCLSIVGNTIESVATATYDCIELNAATLNFIERVIIAGNSLYKGRYGINLTNCSRVKADANMIQAFGTSATNGTLVGTNDNFTT